MTYYRNLLQKEAEVESALTSFLPHLNALIAELEKRVKEKEEEPSQDTKEKVSFSFLRRVVDQGNVYFLKSLGESEFLAVYGDPSKLRRIRNEILALLHL